MRYLAAIWTATLYADLTLLKRLWMACHTFYDLFKEHIYKYKYEQICLSNACMIFIGVSPFFKENAVLLSSILYTAIGHKVKGQEV